MPLVATYPGVCAEILRAVTQAGHGAQSRLAAEVGVTPTAVSEWVQGVSSPGQDRWEAIENALGLPGGRLRAAAGNPPVPGGDDTERRLSKLEREVERIGNLLEVRLQRRGR